VVVEHRHAVEDGVRAGDPGDLGDRLLPVEDVHQRYALEDDVVAGIGIGQRWVVSATSKATPGKRRRALSIISGE
jgi:hypothetical protein